MKPRFLTLVIFFSSILFFIYPSFGGTSWRGTTSTAWATAANWTAGVPTSIIDAVVGDGNFTGSFQPSITAAATAKSLLWGTNKSCTLTVGSTLTVSGTIIIFSTALITGTLNANALVTCTTLTANNLSVIKVNAALFSSNYSVTSLVLNPGSVVEYSSTTINQTISSAYAYSTLRISGTGTIKSLAADLPALQSGATGTLPIGWLDVISGTMDLSTFVANRGNTNTGGKIRIAASAFLKIGGTNSFPLNYSANGLDVASTVEYNGANQSIAGTIYGNLVLSSSGGSVVKTAAAGITINRDITIGVSTTFVGGTFSHSISSDWINNGTFSPGTSTVTFKGSSGISGTTTSPIFYNVTVLGALDLVNSGTVTIQDLVIGSGIGVSLLLDGATVQIAGIISNSGTFDASAGVVEMNGAVAQNIPANTFENNRVDQLLISNSSSAGVSLGGAVDVYGSLTYSEAGLNLITNDFLTLKSNSTNTAWIGDMTGKTITGMVTVERYIAAQKAWRFLSIPTATTQTIQEAWQESATGTGDDPSPGFGTQITSNLDTWSEAGFDLHSTSPSMKRYNSTTDTWAGVPNTNTSSVKVTDGYMIFVRGDRTANAFTSDATETVLRTQGNLYVGDQDPILVDPNEFVSIGNPYASQLDMRFITKSGLKDFFYIWDPMLGGSQGLGGYQTFSNNGEGDYVITPGLGSYSGNNGDISDYIQSGLAFLIQGDTGGGSLTFTEAAKTSGVVSSSIVAALPGARLRTSLYGVNTDNSIYMIDGTLINYSDDYSNSVDNMDAFKSTNASENLSIKTANSLLAIERRHTIIAGDTVFLNLTNTKVQQYRFQFTADKLAQAGLSGFLEDTYLHTSQPLNLDGSTILNFNIVNIPGSYASDRFRIVFTPSLILPVSFTSIKAWQKNKDIVVEWKVENEINTREYEVEKSNNGTQFTSLSVVAAANNGGSASYQVTDASPVEGYNYYRIKSVDINSRTAYTDVVKVWIGKGKPGIIIYPNPVINDIISIRLNNMPEGNYSVKLLNSLGQKVFDKTLQHTEGSSTELITVDKSIPHGIYQLQLITPGNEMITNKLIH